MTPAQLIAARYGITAASEPAEWNAVLDCLLSHRSMRSYEDKPVGDELLHTLMAAAQSAPNSSNLQCWSVVAVRDAATKAALAASCGNQAYVAKAPLFLVWLADFARLDSVARQQGVEPKAMNYLEMLLMASIDTALAAQAFSTAAESVGLGTVFIGGIRNNVDQVASLLKLPPKVAPVFGLCVGYPDAKAAAGSIRPRLAQSVVVHQEQYQAIDLAQAGADYDRAMARYQQVQGMPPEAWTKRSAARVRDAASLNGRDRLRGQLLEMGFRLD